MAGVTALTVVLALAPSAAPGAAAPAPAASEAPLKTIGHVRATTALCRVLVTDASDAIDVETANDARFASTLDWMTVADFDSSQLAKSNAVAELMRRYVEMRAAAVSANGTMAKYKAEAKEATDDNQRKALIAFGDALDGALHRQKILADDLGRFIAYLDAHEPIDKETHEQMQFDALMTQNATGSHGDVLDTVPPQLTTVAKDAAHDLAGRARAVTDDENTAAKRIDDAFAGC